MGARAGTAVERRRSVASGLAVPRLDRRRLRGFERTTIPVIEAINARPPLKALSGRVQLTMWAHAIQALLRRRQHVDGFEAVRALEPRHGIVIVSNHRSYFDLFACCSLMLTRTRLARRWYFPVRTKSWYDSVGGMLVNLAVTGGAMWPPVYRDDRRKVMNAVLLDQLATVLGPGSAIGIHPEGRRNLDGDPWDQLPARRGIGILLTRCHPDVVVIPLFLAGLTDDLWLHLKAFLAPRRSPPVRLRFGAPRRAGDVRVGRTPEEIASDLMAEVARLGQVDRGLWEHRLAAAGAPAVPAPLAVATGVGA